MRRVRTVIRTIKLSATKTFQWSPKTEIAAIKAWRYDSPSLMEREMQSRTPSIIDLNAELAKLTMFQRTPNSTVADRKGSVARLASYRDGLLLAIKASGRDHWERHLTGDELIHVLDGSASLEIVCDDGPPKSFPLRAGTIAIIPQGTWHRFLSSEGFAQIATTPFPGETIEIDVDDPRTVERKPT
jgi:mannose-6-phosphate isomerase-like protein (cupin superfamily)